MEAKQLDDKFTQTELSTLRDDLAKVEQASKMKDDRIHQLEESMQVLQQNFDAVSRLLRLKPRIEDVEAAIRQKRDAPRECSRFSKLIRCVRFKPSVLCLE